jgi:neutral ceramidase
MTDPHPRVASPRITVGAHAIDVTPREPTFLYGYPHVPRTSTGVHDPLLASALFVSDGRQAVLFVSVDVIWLSKRQVAAARERIAAATGVPTDHLMITATHTHAGPVTLAMISNADDPVVPPPNAEYLERLLDGIVAAAVEAHRCAEPAELALVTAECPDIGGNRHVRGGVTVNEIPIVAARAANDAGRWLAVMYINRVHPTVLHEDSTLISGDFPGICRRYLQAKLLSAECPVLCHLGAAGNQSPRHVARSHSYAEAERIGALLGTAISAALDTAVFGRDWSVGAESTSADLPLRDMPTLDEAAALLDSLSMSLSELRAAGADDARVRTGECAVFGAEETVCLARAAANGELQAAARECLPAEIQLIWLGKWSFVAWPGEVFAEFALRVREWDPDTFIITLANGELQGYVVTMEALQQNAYEASNAVFLSPESGEILVRKTLSLHARINNDSHVAPAPGRSTASI